MRVDESRAAFVKVGQDVEIRADAAPIASAALDGTAATAMTGRVAEVARDQGAGAHAFLVKIDLPRDVVRALEHLRPRAVRGPVAARA